MSWAVLAPFHLRRRTLGLIGSDVKSRRCERGTESSTVWTVYCSSRCVCRKRSGGSSNMPLGSRPAQVGHGILGHH